MEVSKLCKTQLEDILCEFLDDINKVNPSLYRKYNDIIGDELYYIDETEAVTIVKSMKPYGEVYSMIEVSKLQIPENCIIKYYLCMNMFYNDYKQYFESKRIEPKEFCFEMSKLFINDVDAPSHKVEKYFKNFEES